MSEHDLTATERETLLRLVRNAIGRETRRREKPHVAARRAVALTRGGSDRSREWIRSLERIAKKLDAHDLARIVGLQTVCKRGHVAMIKPSSIVDGRAVFGGGADFCSYGTGFAKEKAKRCEALVVERTPIYR